jgi:hypothetical protein
LFKEKSKSKAAFTHIMLDCLIDPLLILRVLGC